MNSKPSGPVGRWAHEPPGSGVEAELGEVFRAAAHEEGMTDVELARVGRRVTGGASRRSRSLFRLLPVVLAVLTGSAGAALAQWLHPGIWDLTPKAVPAEKAAPSPSPQAVLPRREPAASPPAGVVVDETPPVAALEPAPGRATQADASSSPSGLALESELLQRALEKLRRSHDGAAALRLLDEHRARFPAGVLGLEAAVARVDALLLLGRRAEALEQLARLPLARVGRRTELQLLRAELYAERDCRKALVDFDAVISASAPAALTERALYGRATCRLRSGDDAGGRVDLQSYLHRFPSGRFAKQVRERLAADQAH